LGRGLERRENGKKRLSAEAAGQGTSQRMGEGGLGKAPSICGQVPKGQRVYGHRRSTGVQRSSQGCTPGGASFAREIARSAFQAREKGKPYKRDRSAGGRATRKKRPEPKCRLKKYRGVDQRAQTPPSTRGAKSFQKEWERAETENAECHWESEAPARTKKPAPRKKARTS